MTGNTITVEWYCGHYTGPLKWRWGCGDWIMEQDECDDIFSTQEDVNDYDAGDCMAVCPNCGAELWQSDFHIYNVQKEDLEEVG